jgi:hypothetical protein
VTKRLAIVLLALACTALVPHPALAYLDPGSGSMILQLVVGGAAGLVVLARLLFRKVMHRLGLKRQEESARSVSGPS